MKKRILVVEDNERILLNIKLILELNGYEVLTALDGKKALEVLNSTDVTPDLIISDIMMPEMDGYDFFSKVSDNPLWVDIPFIFLTAKATPEDVRLGKELGVDDYITKPFDGDDLLSIIAGKLRRYGKSREMRRKIEEKLLSSLSLVSKKIKVEKDSIHFLFVVWDELYGPQVKISYPDNKDTPFDPQQVGTQLFQATVSLYGYSEIQEAQGVLLKIANINRDGFIYFDAIEDKEVRGNKRQFMLALLAPSISYLVSLKIKDLFSEMSNKIKAGEKIEPNHYWKRILDFFKETTLDF